MQKIEGLLTCDDCGATVTTDGAERHLTWHRELDEAFQGAVKLIQHLNSKIGQLSP